MNRHLFFVLVAVLVSTSCAGRSTWTPLERLAEPLTFDNALAGDQNIEDEYWATMQNELGIVLSDETRTDRYGTWHPLTLAPDAPVLDIDPEVVPEDLDPAWTVQEVQAAWQAMAEYLVNEQLDSELVWDDTPENRRLLVDRAGLSVLWAQDAQGIEHFLDADTNAEYAVWLGPGMPLLETMSAGGDWSRQEVDGLVLGLPPSAVSDTDDSCKRRYLEKDPGETFVLDNDSSDKKRCLRVLGWDAAADGPVAEMVGTDETVWYAQVPGLAGTISIGTHLGYEKIPAVDIVDFLLTDGPGAGYRVTAEVPSGTGEQFARQLLATLDVSAAPAPSPS